MKRSEKAITREILSHLRGLPKCHAEKRHGTPFGHIGQPDLTGCIGGRRFELEVKRPGEKPTRIQVACLKQWERAGAIVGVVSALDDVISLFEREGVG